MIKFYYSTAPNPMKVALCLEEMGLAYEPIPVDTRKGATSQEAGGAIHTDIQKGFIRVEIIGWNDFLAAGGETQAKHANKMRVETKSYVMLDFDLANFRFKK